MEKYTVAQARRLSNISIKDMADRLGLSRSTYFNKEKGYQTDREYGKPITIGNNCWIGAKVTILDGTKIGNGCIVAAGAVVKGIFPDNVIIGGVPAKILKYRNEIFRSDN